MARFFTFRCLALAACARGSQMFGAAPSAPDALMHRDAGESTCVGPVQADLRWDVDIEIAESIACHNRRFAEYAGYWRKGTTFPEAAARAEYIEFFDSATGKLLFVAPRGRSMASFLEESTAHGWPSFRDEEVVVETVRVISDGEHTGEIVSVDGTHLGHNLPDSKGNRYCVDLVSVAGRPVGVGEAELMQPAWPVPEVGAGCNASVAVYFGNGCFWHTQYDLYSVERALGRDVPTARVGYGGGVGGSPHNAVCYHRGPPLSYYGSYGYAEAVQVTLDAADAEAQFDALAEAFFVEGFDAEGLRKDPGDRGDEYRNVIGIPGGADGPWFARVKAANARHLGVALLPGDEATVYADQGPVYIYDSDLYPFYVGELKHQFHPNLVTRRDLPASYLVDARAASIEAGAVYPVCGEAGARKDSNIAVCEHLLHGGAEYWMARPPADDDRATHRSGHSSMTSTTYVSSTTSGDDTSEDTDAAFIVVIAIFVGTVAICAFGAGVCCSRAAVARGRYASKFADAKDSRVTIPTESEMLTIPASHDELAAHPHPELVAHLHREQRDADAAEEAAAAAAAAAARGDDVDLDDADLGDVPILEDIEAQRDEPVGVTQIKDFV